jgi:hypothetical protein
MDFLDNLRNKSRRERTKILWISVGVSSFLIFVLWLFVFPKDYFRESQEGKKLSDLRGELNVSDQEFEEFKKNIGLLDDFDKGLNFEEFREEVEVAEKNIEEDKDKAAADSPRTYRLPLEE